MSARWLETASQRRSLLSRVSLRACQTLLDVVVLALSLQVAYALRFEFQMTADVWRLYGAQVGVVVLLEIAALRLFGAYTFLWRYVGLREVQAFGRAIGLASIGFLALRLLELPLNSVALKAPVSVIVLNAALAFAGTAGMRVARRILHEQSIRTGRGANAGSPVLLIGAGQAGVLAAREIYRRGDTGMIIRGFIDDDPAKIGSVIDGTRVLGTSADLPRLVRELGIEQVVITIAHARSSDIRRIVDICSAIPVKTRTIPGILELIRGDVEISRIRNIEIEDLLGREPVELDLEAMKSFLSGKSVMVTGAGGSIGSELARQVAHFQPRALLLVERAEFALFEIDRELRKRHGDLTIEPLVADTGDVPRMRELFDYHRPQVVLHAAAHKHVPMMERQPAEAIKNNVMATKVLGHIAGEFEAEAFVLISTDKAVNPTSVMGASKRVAELVVQDLSHLHYPTRFVAVRFGNVMGSAGSVIPIFRQQIEAGGPVTVTHPEMTRYFMTIPEAAQLVLQAGAIGDGGEIFVLDMGEPVKIVDLAVQMIRLSGLKPHEDIAVSFTGMRPGEKLFEELDRHGETISRTKHPKIFNGNLTPYPNHELVAYLTRLERAARNNRHLDVRGILAEMLPEANLENVPSVYEVVEASRQDKPAEHREEPPVRRTRVPSAVWTAVRNSTFYGAGTPILPHHKRPAGTSSAASQLLLKGVDVARPLMCDGTDSGVRSPGCEGAGECRFGCVGSHPMPLSMNIKPSA